MNDTVHAILSPSSAHRWTRCPGSVAFCGSTPNPDAERGRIIHAEAAAALIARETLPLDHPAFHYVSAVLELYNGASGKSRAALLVEEPVPIDHVTGEPGAVGTLDAAVVTESDLWVFDLKTGHRPVPAMHNEQLLLYASGALQKIKSQGRTVHLLVYQPALGEEPSVWTLSEAEVHQWCEVLRRAAEATRAEDAPLVPGEVQCRWCPAAAVCPALAETVKAQLQAGVPDETAAAAAWGEAYATVPLARRWADAVEDAVRARLSEGKTVAGFALMPGRRPARRWKDEAAAELVLTAVLGNQARATTSKVISPAQAEKLVKGIAPHEWAGVQALIETPAPPLTVKPVSDQFPDLTQESNK